MNETREVALAFFKIEEGGELVTYTLGPGAGYSIEIQGDIGQVVRLWDQECTFLVPAMRLIIARVPNVRKRQ